MVIKFITDRRTPSEPEILEPVKDKSLLVCTIEGQCLGVYEPPKGGWTHEALCALSAVFPKEWTYCGADALIGDQFVGSTEI